MNATLQKTACEICGATEVLSVSMRMGDGEVLFSTCTVCEATLWSKDGAPVSRDAALTHIPRR